MKAKAMNVNRFGQPISELPPVLLRGQCIPADKIRFPCK